MAKRGQTVDEVLAQRLREVRASRMWTQDQLAEALAAAGFPIHRTTLAKIEKGRRAVSVGELFALAAVLDVSPLFLTLPHDHKAPVLLTPNIAIESEGAGRWAVGHASLNEETRRTYLAQVPEWVTTMVQTAILEGRWLALEERFGLRESGSANAEAAEETRGEEERP